MSFTNAFDMLSNQVVAKTSICPFIARRICLDGFDLWVWKVFRLTFAFPKTFHTDLFIIIFVKKKLYKENTGIKALLGLAFLYTLCAKGCLKFGSYEILLV